MLKTINESALPATTHGQPGAWVLGGVGGLVLDGMDSFIYALVLLPAMRDLLPRSGIAPTIGNLGFYGSILFSVFLVGWGCAFLWGPIADRFGRVRALIFAILCYSVFTFLGCMAQNIWQLGLFRFFAGFGVGGEFVGAAVFVAEELPGGRRVSGAGYLNTGYYVGIFLAAALNYLIGARLGWRAYVRRWARTRPVSSPTSAITCVSRNVGQNESRAWGRGRQRFVLCSLLARVSQANHSELHLPAGLDDRSVGRIGVCARCCHPGRASRRILAPRTRPVSHPGPRCCWPRALSLAA